METKRSQQLTWADVKVGDVFEDDNDFIVWKQSPYGGVYNTGVMSCMGDWEYEGGVVRIIGRFDPSWLDLDNGGFTIPEWYCEAEGCGKRFHAPDDVLFEHNEKLYCEPCYDEITAEPKGKPAVEFEAGEWFRCGEYKYLKTHGGAFRIHNGEPYTFCNEEINDAVYQDCPPCEPDFFIFTEKELRDVKEQEYLRGLQDRKELRGAGGIDDTPEGDAVEEFLDHIIEKYNDGLIDGVPRGISLGGYEYKLLQEARDQYERMKEEALDEVLSDTHGLTAAYAVGRDHGRNEQPTIPQEVREFVEYVKEKRMTHLIEGKDGVFKFFDPDTFHGKLNAALQALTRCDPPKPHPLTKVRELVEKCNRSDVLCKWTGDLAIEARKELAEYDGEVGDE